MHNISYEIRQQYHKHGVMHRAFLIFEKLLLHQRSKYFYSMVHNEYGDKRSLRLREMNLKLYSCLIKKI